ncbi:hypothetical protein [Limnoglobus roseus]|uniref:Uncharacterized protein n=1 Tax=Limnoglobus roseus TaxID=2598579 RepID=A0A5C1ACR8_9BACT|nr:hypothetical protein [Limnoglobus roseus]QEL15786.1 hypothetical protein PX52LOC_02722 [Limnoglobus roseus]
MLFAELANKLGRNSERAHERGEDLLTSTAFQLLRYIPFRDGLFPILSRANQVCREGKRAWVSMYGLQLPADVDGCTFRFWPRLRGNKEPDLIATFTQNGVPFGSVVVEVKLDSRKSGTDDEDFEPSESRISRDQLLGYWQLLQEESLTTGVPPLGVIYLTADVTPPKDELESSLSRPGDWLYWLSWHSVAEVVQRCARSGIGGLPAQDLIDILRKKGLGGFMGFPKDEPTATVGAAVNKVYEWHIQVREFYNALDQIFDRFGWPTPKKAVPVGDVRGRLTDDPERWSLYCFFREYGPNDGTAIAIICHLSPAVEGDLYEPRCLAAKVRGTLCHIDIKNKFPDVGPAVVELGASRQFQALSPQARKALLDRTDPVVCLSVPLSALTSLDDVRTMIVQPILDAQIE